MEQSRYNGNDEARAAQAPEALSPYHWSSGPQTVQHADDFPEAVSSVNHQHSNGYLPYHETQYQQVPGYKHDTQYAGTHTGYTGSIAPASAASPDKERRTCGLKRKTFLIVLAVVIVGLVVAIVGGVAGGVLSQRSSSSSQSSASSTPSPSPSPTPSGISNIPSILHTSSALAAVNWTDPQRYAHQAIFWQSNASALHMTVWDAVNTTWETRNVSDILSRRGSPITVKTGTSIGAAVAFSPWPFQINLYYLTPDNVIGELYSTRQDGLEWAQGQLSSRFPKKAAASSQLAALWPRCARDCSGDLLTAYEDEDHNMAYINGSDASKVVTVRGGVTPGSSLALLAYAPDKPLNNGTANELRLFYGVDSGLVEGKFVGNGSGNWDNTQNSVQTLSKTPPPRFAAGAFDGFTQMLVAVLLPTGGVAGSWWDKTKWNLIPKLEFSGGPENANFSAHAMNNDRTFFGISKEGISKYVLDSKSPTTLIFSEKIPLP